MKICFCDLCSQPIKGYKWKVIFCQLVEEPLNQDASDLKNFVMKNEKEVCETCYKILQDFFDYRMITMCDMLEELRKIDSLIGKYPPKVSDKD